MCSLIKSINFFYLLFLFFERIKFCTGDKILFSTKPPEASTLWLQIAGTAQKRMARLKNKTNIAKSHRGMYLLFALENLESIQF